MDQEKERLADGTQAGLRAWIQLDCDWVIVCF